MFEDPLQDINERLSKFAKIQGDWPKAVSEELGKVQGAVEFLNVLLTDNHTLEIDVTWVEEENGLWEFVRITLERGSDGFEFPNELTLELRSDRVIHVAQTANPEKKGFMKVFVGQCSSEQWRHMITGMIQANLKLVGA